MLVSYTPIPSLSEGELAALKADVRGKILEGHGSHYVFAGRTFSMAELRSAQRAWRNEDRGPRQALFEGRG